jgi:phospholipase D3/4
VFFCVFFLVVAVPDLYGILQGSTNLATNTSTGLENGSIQGMLSGVQASMSPFRDAPLLGLFSTRPQSLSSPVRITSGVNQATLGELSHSLGRMNGHMNYSFQGMGELTSGTPYNMTPIGTNSNSRTVEALDSRHISKVGSGNLNGHSFDRAEGGKFGYHNLPLLMLFVFILHSHQFHPASTYTPSDWK